MTQIQSETLEVVLRDREIDRQKVLFDHSVPKSSSKRKQNEYRTFNLATFNNVEANFAWWAVSLELKYRRNTSPRGVVRRMGDGDVALTVHMTPNGYLQSRDGNMYCLYDVSGGGIVVIKETDAVFSVLRDKMLAAGVADVIDGRLAVSGRHPTTFFVSQTKQQAYSKKRFNHTIGKAIRCGSYLCIPEYTSEPYSFIADRHVTTLVNVICPRL